MLKRIVESLAEVPAELREHYVLNDRGRFELEVDGGSALREWKERARDLERKLAEAQEAGKPPTDETPRDKLIRESAARLAPFEHGSAEYTAELAKINSEMETLVDAETTTRRDAMSGDIEKMRQSIERSTVRRAAMRIATGLARPGSVDVLLPHIEARLSAKWDGDECVPFFTAADGGEYSEAGLIAEFREMRPEFEPVIAGTTPAEKSAYARKFAETFGGTAAPPRTLTRAAFEQLTPQAQADAMSTGTKLVDH